LCQLPSDIYTGQSRHPGIEYTRGYSSSDDNLQIVKQNCFVGCRGVELVDPNAVGPIILFDGVDFGFEGDGLGILSFEAEGELLIGVVGLLKLALERLQTLWN
jgi:hypothetical protein